MADQPTRSVRAAAQALGVTLVLAEHTPQQYADAFTLFSRARAEALFVSGSPTAYVDRALIVDFATRTRLASSFAYREPVELGGLMSYGVNLSGSSRRAATFVDKILKGPSPPTCPSSSRRSSSWATTSSDVGNISWRVKGTTTAAGTR